MSSTKGPTADTSPRRTARVAGVFYLLEMLVGGISLYSLGRIVVSGDATATATNTLAHGRLFQLSFAADLLQFACYLVVTCLLYRLFRPVNESVSLLAAFFSLAGCIIGASSCLFQIAPLIVLSGSQYLNVFSTNQLQTLAFVLHRLYSQGLEISFVFFGFYCLLIGYLIYRSGFMSRLLGCAMALSGLGWLVFLLPALAHRLLPYLLLSALGELALVLGLLIFAVDEQRWMERAGA